MREAFKQFLAGNHNYAQLSKLLGVTPRGMHLILRNPIWTGWRVIDKKRDKSAKGRYPSRHGRQADRRKIQRPPEEIIRVRVIKDALVSQADFDAVQRIMDLKKTKHWRMQPQRERRFTYNGFLTCSQCGEVIHTAFARRDYYACSGRRGSEKCTPGSHKCTSKYMGRERLEAKLDSLIANYLTQAAFLTKCVEAIRRKSEQGDHAGHIRRLTEQLTSLETKRKRVIDGFIEGLFEREERNRRLANIDQQIHGTQQMLMRESPAATLDFETLVDTLAQLAEWAFWSREQKRAVLTNLMPEIRVADYKVESLGLSAAIFSNESTRSGTDSSPRPT